MQPDETPIRHAQLFELLRQKNLSDVTAERLQRLSKPQPDASEMLLLQSLAAQSWSRPNRPAKQPSAPEPRRDYKFFGAVRA